VNKLKSLTLFPNSKAQIGLGRRVARSFLGQHTKTVKIHQMTIKYARWPQNIPNGRKIDQMAIKTHCKTLQNLPEFGFLV
jgi:hypothetical protein